MAAAFVKGTWVWLDSLDEIAVPAEVLKDFARNEEATVRTEDGAMVTLSPNQTAKIMACNPEVLSPGGIEDLITLADLTEKALLHSLRVRFESDIIYTHVGSILVSVNPFKNLPLYTDQILSKYFAMQIGMQPHIFAVAGAAYSNMIAGSGDRQSLGQSMLISGESGAGKTEATKQILRYLTEASSKQNGSTKGSGLTDMLEKKLLQSNPLTESFGNATTSRNDNSSRFGKLISIMFSTEGSIEGGSMINYMLEKSRVVRSSEEERNYHIFYQLLAAAQSDRGLRDRLQLNGNFNITETTCSLKTINGMSDREGYNTVATAAKLIGISAEEMDGVYSALSAILHLGNVDFDLRDSDSGQDCAVPKNASCIATAARFLGVEPILLEKAITSHSVQGKSSVVFVLHSVEQAITAVEGLCMNLFSNIFDWLINKINIALATMRADVSQMNGGADVSARGSFATMQAKCIHVLDIFGFESFEHNSFEQLCINYCNEMLQAHFNEHIFTLEQEEYIREGINVGNVGYISNHATLDALQARHVGLFAQIDEALMISATSDEQWLNKLLKAQADNDNICKPKPNRRSSSKKAHEDMEQAQAAQHADGKSSPGSQDRDGNGQARKSGWGTLRAAQMVSATLTSGPQFEFLIKHYAEDVVYDANGFLEKSADSLHSDIEALLTKSRSDLVAQLMYLFKAQRDGPPQEEEQKTGGKVRKRRSRRQSSGSPMKSVGMQFKTQLTQLMALLNQTSPHFVRCVKSSSAKKPDDFEPPLVLKQLRSCGMLEVCKMRKIGYCSRIPMAEFEELWQWYMDASASGNGGGQGSKHHPSKAILTKIEQNGLLKREEWVIGKTKVFLKDGCWEQLWIFLVKNKTLFSIRQQVAEMRIVGEDAIDFALLREMRMRCARMVAYRRNDGETEGEPFELLDQLERVYATRLAGIAVDVTAAEAAKSVDGMQEWANKLGGLLEHLDGAKNEEYELHKRLAKFTERFRSLKENYDRSIVAMEAALKSGEQDVIKEALRMPILKSLDEEQVVELRTRLEERLAQMIQTQGEKEESKRDEIAAAKAADSAPKKSKALGRTVTTKAKNARPKQSKMTIKPAASAKPSRTRLTGVRGRHGASARRSDSSRSRKSGTARTHTRTHTHTDEEARALKEQTVQRLELLQEHSLASDTKHAELHHRILEVQQDVVLATDAQKLASENFSHGSAESTVPLSGKATKALELQKKIDATKEGGTTATKAAKSGFLSRGKKTATTTTTATKRGTSSRVSRRSSTSTGAGARVGRRSSTAAAASASAARKKSSTASASASASVRKSSSASVSVRKSSSASVSVRKSSSASAADALALPSSSRAANSKRPSIDAKLSHRKISRMVDSTHTKAGKQAPTIVAKKKKLGNVSLTREEQIAAHHEQKRREKEEVEQRQVQVNLIRADRVPPRRTSSIIGRYREMQAEHPNLYGDLGPERLLNLVVFKSSDYNHKKGKITVAGAEVVVSNYTTCPDLLLQLQALVGWQGEVVRLWDFWQQKCCGVLPTDVQPVPPGGGDPNVPLVYAEVYDNNALMIDKQDAGGEWEMKWDAEQAEKALLDNPKPAEYADSAERVQKILKYYKTFAKKPEQRRQRLQIQSRNRWRRACIRVLALNRFQFFYVAERKRIAPKKQVAESNETTPCLVASLVIPTVSEAAKQAKSGGLHSPSRLKKRASSEKMQSLMSRFGS